MTLKGTVSYNDPWKDFWEEDFFNFNVPIYRHFKGIFFKKKSPPRSDDIMVGLRFQCTGLEVIFKGGLFQISVYRFRDPNKGDIS